jgi:LysR family transcriptional regulator, low CO2-responsive transcriptional regulator
VEKFFTEHGLTLKAAMEMNKNEAIKQAVEAGLGLGVVSLHTVQAELAARHLCVLDVRAFRCDANGIWCNARASA